MAAKKSSRKSSKKYSPAAGRSVKKAMGERKRGQLRSGRSKKKVTSRKQAIAIGLSEAREAGADVPPPPGGRRGSKKTASKKSSRKKSGSKKSGSKKSGSKKSGSKKSGSKKS